ncbi:MAG: CPBP family intramembrane metalloprotease [Theionarchaea archaeon]|nr:CPBP family intramembrane metalloprotease [Theionarchaea archaeon]
MANWLLFLCLFAVSIPGIAVTVPSAIKSMEGRIREAATAGKKIPPMKVIIAVAILQTSLLVLIADAAGTIITPRIGFSAPFFEALITGENVWGSLQPQLLPSIVLGIIGGLLLVSSYYLLFRPRLDEQTVKTMESLRMNLGLSGRSLYGGVVEEILTRWGLQSVLIWLIGAIAGGTPPGVIIISLIVTGILFGLGHLPSYLGAGCRGTPLFITMEITLNLGASLIFGWLFWHYGLVSAMIAHMLFHVVWYPFDLHFSRLSSLK